MAQYYNNNSGAPEATTVNEYTNVVPDAGYSHFLMYCIESQEEINELEHQLMNERFDVTKNEFVQVGEPLMNVDEIKFILSTISMKLKKTTTLSNIPEQTIFDIMHGLNKKFGLYFARYRDLGIRDYATALLIEQMIEDAVYISLLKAKNSNTLNAARAMERISEVNQIQKQKKGFLDNFNPLK
jgi:hypothetical protein